MKFDERGIERMEKLFAVAKVCPPIPPEELAILAELEDLLRATDAPNKLRDKPELVDLAVSRALEKQGRSTLEIAETIAGWRATLEEFEGGGGTGYEPL